jgi:protein gp37
MAENSKIEWCDHTFNAWIGCAKVSPGCAHCYAEARDRRLTKGGVAAHWGRGAPRVRTKTWGDPLEWNRDKYLVCDLCGTAQRGAIDKDQGCDNPNCEGARAVGSYHRARVFSASLSDWLDEEVAIEWLVDLLQVIYKTPNLDWLLLTKRPENFLPRLLQAFNVPIADPRFGDWLEGWHPRNNRPPANVWAGTTVEDQERAQERIPALLRIPARVRFLSVEPMLENIDFGQVCTDPPNSGLAITDWLGRPDGEGRNEIHWAIFGGESGGEARRCRVDWIRYAVSQCRAAGVAAFVKQLGANVVDRNDVGFEGDAGGAWPMDTRYDEIDSGYQGAPVRIRLKAKKGGDWREWPEDLKIREFPTVEVAR